MRAGSSRRRASYCVGTAGRVTGDREAPETEGVGEPGHVERPVLEAATRLQVGAAEAGPVYGDEVHTGRLRRLLVGTPEPAERRPMEEEDRPSVHIAPLRICEGATILKPHTLVSDRLPGRGLHSSKYRANRPATLGPARTPRAQPRNAGSEALKLVQRPVSGTATSTTWFAHSQAPPISELVHPAASSAASRRRLAARGRVLGRPDSWTIGAPCVLATNAEPLAGQPTELAAGCTSVAE